MTTQDPPSPAEHPADPHAQPHGVGHVVPLSLLVKVFAALVLLTIITVAASTVDFGEANLIVALVIAVVKASLVVLFFMHLLWDKPFNSIVFVGCLIFVGLFISLTLLDSHQYRGSVQGGQASGVKDYHKLLKPESTEPPAAPPAKP